jgi:xeroderma pigmentosum group C-complementing protein
MPPKSRSKDVKGKVKATELATEKRRSGRRKVAGSSAVPDVFKDMLAEAVSPSQVDEEEMPRKRRRKVQAANDVSGASVNENDESKKSQTDNDASIEFEDVISPKWEQTAYNDSEDASSEDDLAWEEVGVVDFVPKPDVVEEGDGDLDLTLTAETLQRRKSAVTRRKAINNAERALRLNIHKMHVLCLLSYVDRRNNWCNDKEAQSALRSLLTKQMIECLRPKESYTQFGKAESVKKGLALVAKMWESKYSITAKGMHRAYWAENEREIKEVNLVRIIFDL